MTKYDYLIIGSGRCWQECLWNYYDKMYGNRMEK